ncbi:hypothetical protein ACWGJ9_09610 [Curtobacterium citreum]
MNAAVATTTTILSVGSFFGAIGVTIALCNAYISPKAGSAWIAALVAVGAVFAGVGVGFSQ